MNFYKYIHRWRLRHISEPVFVMLLAVIVGLLSGLAAVLLKTVVHYAGALVTRLSTGSWHVLTGNWQMLLI